MRIAQVAPLFESVPPALYGGSERVVSWLTEELVRMGHEVTLFASGDSKTGAQLVPVCEKALWRDKECRETLPHHVRMMEMVFRDVSRFDVIHFHCDYLHFPLVRRYACASVTTLHGYVHAHDLRGLLEEYTDVSLVSISNSQRAPVPQANWQGTVYHGLPERLHTFRPGPGRYLAFLGRISPEKGLERAIEIARRSGMPLKVAAKIYDEDRSYFERVIQPLLATSNSFVEFVGEVGGAAKDEFLGGAAGLLFPVEWPEPFGLVMIEAMACGTPVIAWRRGSVPEVMKDGVTGFVVDSVEDAVRCVPRLAGIRREDCRRSFEARFGAARMAMDYLRVYEKVIADARMRRMRSSDGMELDAVSELTGSNNDDRCKAPEDVLERSGDAQHILANADRTAERFRTLKCGDTFAVFDHHGDIRPSAMGDGTRFLSCLMVSLDGLRPLLLGSTVRDDNDQLVVTLTNPDLILEEELQLPANSIHISRRVFLLDAVCYTEIRLENYAFETVNSLLTVQFAADYKDIYEVRGMSREARGEDFAPYVREDNVTLHYRGLDHEVRSTDVRFSPQPDYLCRYHAEFRLTLRPREVATIVATVACRREMMTDRFDRSDRPVPGMEEALRLIQSEIEESNAASCRLQSTNGQFNEWVNRALSDLHMMITPLETGPYPYAGVPWFNTPFGRDGIITAWECLWMRPELAKGVLAYLASTQATEVVPEQDAEPGKILHETRSGEMAALKEMPFGRYYGTVDATPLFVALAGAYYERTGDVEFVRELWPHLRAALQWMEVYGDRDGDGFLEYERRSANGLIHQGWKDADDAIFHHDGSPALGAIALCEVQGYAYAAYRAAGLLAGVLGLEGEAADFSGRAVRLRERFNEVFWCEKIGGYAIALDGEKKRCCVVTSNAGQCLFTGIATEERAARIAETLLSEDSFSGWGIRTVSRAESRFNPMAYHNGSVWPHDNALIAYGMARYGLTAQANRVFKGLFDAAMYLDLHRMPELFCGFPRESGEGPVLYPVACAPQAWSAASVFMLFQACCGIQVDGVKRQIVLVRPMLPEFLNEIRIVNLQVGHACLDLDVTRHGDNVGITVRRNNDNIAVVLMK